MTDTTPTPADRPADQLRAAADMLGPEPSTPVDLTAEYPDLNAAYGQLLRNTAETVDAVARHCPEALDETAHWLAPALAVARQLLGTTVAEPESGCAHCGSPDHAWDDCAAYTALVRDDAAAPPAPADRAAVLRVVDRLAAHAVGFQDVLDESDRGPWGELILADIADLRALAAGAAPAPRCPRCNEDLTDYTDDDRVYRTGDTRPYCSGECVVFAYRRKLPIPSWAADAADAAAGVQPPTEGEAALRVRISELAGSWRLGADEGDLGPGWASAAAALLAVVDNPHITHTEVGLDHPATTGRAPAAPAAPEETTR
ncbi:MAG: hypothetical protein HOV70_10840 [Streptomyces sp.]|nr:hypothetical protein [Streptomyces sp.]